MTQSPRATIARNTPNIAVVGVGGGGGNAINNMIAEGIGGVDFIAANTDAQALKKTDAPRLVQLSSELTGGLGAGADPEVGRQAAIDSLDEIMDHLSGYDMCFITAGMGGGTGTGAAPVIAEACRAKNILTVGVVTLPFSFEGARRMRAAEYGFANLLNTADTVIVIPNQNLLRIADAGTTFENALKTADKVLSLGVRCITDLILREGLVNLDFADVRYVMKNGGRALMGTAQAKGPKRASEAAAAAIANPLLGEPSLKEARGALVSISGGNDLTLYEIDEAMTLVREAVSEETDVVMGASFDPTLDGAFKISVVATGLRN
ncbi:MULTISPECIES: cell division protein FtsZ [Agrobacterium]|jgi:cell division protein FtsZ|uniref:Cell division protein FtsZ n=4 Tax=Agrobacterium tumefaciens complex TaxID=1183400 RepID=A0AAW8LXG5_AGRTU|nr:MULTISPECIES: cell division protein FtsZ [Agrobacterium]MCP2136029.1 cell division protein FtsZ [Rhizobium sp. SLBN-94]TGE78411.1 cell division protein FtsZ [Rhizobium sp. SEMIA 439]AYM84694.1 cell division protein FtsZ [Agrobacterium tumefaciens]EPR20147.1 cell division protein FtsZ [Agrobacterium radiobacter DSM 30147]KAA1232824.1 cell division protein FtsZ [Agrobacterium tumefaciens]